jgi:biotin-(acetyl-CoA carboxylase) ligase
VVQSAGDVVGVARGVNAAGHLLLDLDDGSRVTITVGDVIHLRPAE